MASMTVEIITGERVLYSGDASSVVIPGLDGELGILPHHASLMTCLQPGEIVVSKETGEDDFYAVGGGFVEVMANKVTILADSAERSDEIDEERVREAMRKAEERVAARADDIDLERAIASLRRSQARLKVAQRRRRSH